MAPDESLFNWNSRRGVLKTLGAGALGLTTIGTGTAGASHVDWFPPLDSRTRWGDSIVMGRTGIIQPFLRVTRGGDTQYIGVYVTGWTLDQLPTEGHHIAHFLSLPDGSPFTHVGLDWNPHGHEPPGIYTEPHFDFHFHMLEEETVKSIEGGPAMYSLPSDQMPAGYIRPPAIDTDGDGEPDTPAIVPQMGDHLVNPQSPEFQGETFTHTHIFGAFDPDGDGTGQLTFMEPMITRAFFKEHHEEVRTEISMPDAFPEAGRYPTEYVIRYRPNQNGYVVTMESFERFPASTG